MAGWHRVGGIDTDGRWTLDELAQMLPQVARVERPVWEPHLTRELAVGYRY
jgi:hypothetical protein